MILFVSEMKCFNNKYICIKKLSNYLSVIFLSILNLWVMHHYFVFHGFLEGKLFKYSYIVNACTIVIDISIIMALLLTLSFGRLRLSTYLTYILTLIWSFVNVFYGRFFFHYLSLSAVGQAGGLTDNVVIKSIFAGFQWTDLYYVFSLLLFICVCCRNKLKNIKLSWKKIIFVWIVYPFVSLIMIFLIYSSYHFLNSGTRNNLLLYKIKIVELVINPTKARNAYPNNVVYHAGIVRCLISELNEIFSPYIVTNEQRIQIEQEFFNHENRLTEHVVNPEIKNVVFILLESILSVTSDLVVDGKRITPYLDSLKHANDVYYNGHVHPNITIGESGDGQFIYMTGILPLRSKYTVGEVKNNNLPYALPRLFMEKMNIDYTEVILPTSLNVWQQESMNRVYDLRHCYEKSMVDGNQGEDLTDESVFLLAMNTAKVFHQPFFSIVLSISTHQPYREIVDPFFHINDNNLPHEYLRYLNACHFMDMQVKKYIEYLKRENIFDNSLIIIASDHHAHLDAMGMDGKISTDLPLYIINGNIDKTKAYDGPCNQLDLYTTILDVLHIENEWRGLGYSLLKSNYQNSVTEHTYDISEWIIMGDYFSTK